jgi:3-methyl-2-oxobutanoate hydroxymethyltransferase
MVFGQPVAGGEVKLEGGVPMAETIEAITRVDIPVMAHIGLTPQSATKLGGFRAQGRTAEAALKLHQDALALQAAGCFAIVLEAVPAAVAERVTEALTIPTIGIGSGAGCAGQVLVLHDLLGLYGGFTPRFTKRYAEIGEEIREALERFAADVRSGAFPTEEHTYAMPAEELEAFLSSPTPPARTGT